ncbi:MAG: Pulmonary surfactant-associated protein [Chthonomonadaceae bacterium]|nr:Pulmonary surfactant-associated protein [Chthonomonadaceae bacterium]
MTLPSLTNYQLEDFLRKQDIPVQVISKDEITSKPHRGTYIVNLEDSDDPRGGSHWCLATITPLPLSVRGRKRAMIWFDSFGADMPEVVRTWMKSSGLPCYYSNQQVQAIDASSCGFWCMLVEMMSSKGIKFADILATFSTSTEENERKLSHFFKRSKIV